MKQGEVLLEVARNEMVESIHSGHLLITGSDSSDRLSLGSVNELIYPRSAVKSIQASAMVRAGVKLNGEQLATACASHAGSARHLEVIRSTLASVGLNEAALRNTPDKPLGTSERVAWRERPPSSLAANCSGKHSAMLATCVKNNWDITSYKNPSHQLQLAIRNEFEELSGEKITKVGVDGCGAPLFALSLRALSQAIRNLTISNDPVHREVVSVCRNNPYFVSGAGRLPTTLMEKVDGLFVKDGAEGVMVMSLADGSTIVWKMSDGSQRGASVLACATLKLIGVDLTLEPESVMGDGRVVGEIRASRLVHHG